MVSFRRIFFPQSCTLTAQRVRHCLIKRKQFYTPKLLLYELQYDFLPRTIRQMTHKTKRSWITAVISHNNAAYATIFILDTQTKKSSVPACSL